MKKITFIDSHTVSFKELKIEHPHEYRSIGSSRADISSFFETNILVTNKYPINSEIISKMQHLELIVVAATGYDHIDLKSAAAKGISVCNVPDYSSVSVAEQAMLFMLALANHFSEYALSVKNMLWCKSDHFSIMATPRFELDRKILAIVGRGNTGTQLSTLAQAFGMNVIFCERKGALVVRPGYISFNEAVSQADFISLHCPSMPGDGYLFGENEFSMMRRSSFLLNLGRGKLVNPEHLKNALVSGQIAGAAIDVLEQEPPDINNILMSDVPNLIITPHIAWRTIESEQRLKRTIEENINNYFQGTPTNLV